MMNIEDLMEVIGEVDDKWVDNYSKKKKSIGFPRIFTKAAAVIVGVLVLSFAIIKMNPAFAEKIKSFFGGYIGKDNKNINLTETPDMENKVEKDVLTDENEHLRFEILEQLNDGMMIFMTVRYTAKDDIGRKWLADHYVVENYGEGKDKTYFCRDDSEYSKWKHNVDWDDTVQSYVEDNLSLWLLPDRELGFVDTGFGGFRELYEYQSEDERYFVITMLMSSPDYLSSQKVLLRYPFMDSCKGITIIPNNNKNEFVSYKLLAEDENEKHTDIKSLRVSGLSFILDSDNTDFPVNSENIAEQIEIYTEESEENYICTLVGYKSLISSQSSNNSSGTVYNGYFNKHGEEKNDLNEYEYFFSFDKKSVTKVIIAWYDGTKSVYKCER
ncbi:MAG: DUF4179 domain-containing protein [Lachnospiraceae bacterium]|nr:DUF4179 domain-containing protein [Lachnospiraceae bacterium]